MNDEEIYGRFKLHPVRLNGVLDKQKTSELIEQWDELFHQPAASSHTSIVYVWATDRPIPRLRGHSNIIYIGKTVRSIRARYRRGDILKELPDWSVKRYTHIISSFGPISFILAHCENPKDMEKQFIGAYYREHLESPPFNRQS